MSARKRTPPDSVARRRASASTRLESSGRVSGSPAECLHRTRAPTVASGVTLWRWFPRKRQIWHAEDPDGMHLLVGASALRILDAALRRPDLEAVTTAPER